MTTLVFNTDMITAPRGDLFAVGRGGHPEIVIPSDEVVQITINGFIVTMHAVNTQIKDFPQDVEGIHWPIYFETTGRRYHYAVSADHDKVEIEVCDPITYEVRSIMHPRTQDELTQALATIIGDATFSVTLPVPSAA